MSSDDTLSKQDDSQKPASEVETAAAAQPEQSAEPSTPPEAEPESAVPVEPSSSDEATAETTTNAESPQPVTEPTVPSETSSEESPQADPPRRQLRLNPKLGEGDPAVKAVPSIGSSLTSSREATETTVRTAAQPAETESDSPGTISSSAPAGESPPADVVASDTTTTEASESQASSQPPPAASAPPIELPPAVGDLDAQIEAEIEAALASGEIDAIGSVDAAAAVESAAVAVNEETLEAGQQLSGKIQSIHGENVFLELGCRSPGIVPKRQFVAGKPPEVGQVIAVVVDRVDQEEGLIQVNLPKGVRKSGGNWESMSKGQTVECIVARANKGGLEVTVSSLRGFLPASQIELGFVSDLESYVGQKFEVQIIEVNQRKKNLVVSRRASLEVERKQLAEELWKTLSVGQTVSGKVKTIKPYGAFVDIGGADGLNGYIGIDSGRMD